MPLMELPRRTTAMLRASMSVAILIAAIRVAWLGSYGLWALSSLGAADLMMLVQLAFGILVGLLPVAVAAVLTSGVVLAGRGTHRGLLLLRAGHGAALADALLWLVLALVYSGHTLELADRDPSVGMCLFPVLGVMGVRVLVSIASGTFYAVTWVTLERALRRTAPGPSVAP